MRNFFLNQLFLNAVNFSISCLIENSFSNLFVMTCMRNILMKFKNWWENWAFTHMVGVYVENYCRGEVKNSYWQSVELVKLVKYWIWKFRRELKVMLGYFDCLECWWVTEIFFEEFKREFRAAGIFLALYDCCKKMMRKSS